MKRKFKAIAATVAILVVLLFAFRGVLLRSYVGGKCQLIEQKLGVEIDYSALIFSGFSKIVIEGFSLKQADADTLISLRRAAISLNPFKLLMRAQVRVFDIDGLHLNFVKRDSTSNYDFLYAQTPDSDTTKIKKDVKNFSRHVERIANLLFGLLPNKAHLNDIRIAYSHNDYRLTIAVDSLEKLSKDFATTINVDDNGVTQQWLCRGKIDKHRDISITLFSAQQGNKITIPFIDYRYQAQVSLDSISAKITRSNSFGATKLSGAGEVRGMTINHSVISPKDVILRECAADFTLNIGKNFVELDSSSVVRVNNMSLNPYVRAQHDDSWRFTVAIDKKDFDANDLFSSLPEGLFMNLDGIKCEGRLSYHFLLDLDMGLVDSMRLESKLHKEKFRITQLGNTNLRRMNDEFIYTAYEHGEPVRSFAVGASNPNFTPLNQISTTLQTCVKQGEDGEFFNHQGFLIEAIREAVIKDIKRGKFASGGSTISMQLVKNVFLSRNKTIARKAEEALIVWLIEENRLTSKERMFEVYLNIVEWGVGIYGIGEAARFYFDKTPANLDINESIFLASIIPSPKRALGAFDENFALKEHLAGYYRIIGERLVVKGIISQEQADSIAPSVELKNGARKILEKRMVELRPDSLLNEVTL